MFFGELIFKSKNYFTKLKKQGILNYNGTEMITIFYKFQKARGVLIGFKGMF